MSTICLPKSVGGKMKIVHKTILAADGSLALQLLIKHSAGALAGMPFPPTCILKPCLPKASHI